MKRFLRSIACMGILSIGLSAVAQTTTVTFRQGENGYFGASDTYIQTGDPDDTNDGAVEFEWDGSDAGGRNFALVKFEGIFSNEGGPIPPGSTITEASLTTVISNNGSCDHTSTIYNMIREWDAPTATYNLLFSDVDISIAPTPGEHVGNAGLVFMHDPCTAGNTLVIPITELLQEMSDGLPNNGFVIIPEFTSTNGYGHQASELGDFPEPPRPKLIVETSAGTFEFQRDLNGYDGVKDAWIGNQEDRFITNYGSSGTIDLELDSAEDVELGLIRFDDIIGDGPGQIPTSATVTSAVLRLNVVDGGDLVIYHEIIPLENEFVNTFFDEETVAYENFIDDGFFAQPGLEIAENPLGEFDPNTGQHDLDVTASLQKWVADPSSNYGWLFEPTTGGGIQMLSSDFVPQAPLLTVTFEGETVSVDEYMLHQ